jgi:hypothetical protein
MLIREIDPCECILYHARAAQVSKDQLLDRLRDLTAATELATARQLRISDPQPSSITPSVLFKPASYLIKEEMSFGWSAGDIITAVNILLEITQALNSATVGHVIFIFILFFWCFIEKYSHRLDIEGCYLK